MVAADQELEFLNRLRLEMNCHVRDSGYIHSALRGSF